MWGALGRAIFPASDPTWQWRRRMALTGAAVNLSGIVSSIWFPISETHADMVMGACQLGFLGAMGLYGTMATVDDHLKRNAPKPQGEGQP